MSKITNSARGEQCQIRIPGVCNFNPETTVFCHANGSAAGKGIGMKCPDYIGAYGCSDCHDVIDRRRKAPFNMAREEVLVMFAQGVWRTQRILEEKGLLKIA